MHTHHLRLSNATVRTHTTRHTPSLLACCPSILSNVWYTNRFNPQTMYAQGGIGASMCGLSTAMKAKLTQHSARPKRVMALGASHVGIRLTQNAANGFRKCWYTIEALDPLLHNNKRVL